MINESRKTAMLVIRKRYIGYEAVWGQRGVVRIGMGGR